MSETNRIEYKEILTKEVDLEKEVIAFLNYQLGGALIFGVNKHGKTVGITDIDDAMLRIKDRLKTNIQPSCMGLFDISMRSQDGKNILKVTIASGSEKPYFKKKYGMSEKGCYIRIGTASEPMPQRIIDTLYASRTRNTISKIVSPKQSLAFEQLHIYYQEKEKTLNAQFAVNLELKNEDDQWNYAGYLLSDINNISIKVAKYAGTDRVELTETNEYGYCSLIKACKSVLDKLTIENRTLAKITEKDRIEHRLWNARALREAVINAFVHNDFSREVPPKFEIFNDRIEITSAGSLVDGLSESEFFKGFSIPRNKELIRIFKDLDLVEQLGSGVPRMLAAYDKDCFKFSDNFLRLVFPAVELVSNYDGNQDSNQDVISGGIRKAFGKNSESVRKELGTEVQKVYEIIRLNPSYTAENIAKEIGKTSRTIEKYISKLKERKFIKRQGPKLGGYWDILE